MDSDSPKNRSAASKKDYEVGYKRTLKASRFQKGKSGNPGGKRKKPPDIDIKMRFRELIASPVTITRDGRIQSVTILEGTLLALAGKAMKGDMAAIREMLRITDRYCPKSDVDEYDLDIDYGAKIRAKLDEMVERRAAAQAELAETDRVKDDLGDDDT